MHEHLYNETPEKTGIDYVDDFQTPAVVGDYMVSLIKRSNLTIYEPTPGKMQLVRAISRAGHTPIMPNGGDYFMTPPRRYDAVVMNPPFSSKFLIGKIPDDFKDVGMKAGYKMLFECMNLADEVVALMPYFTISDSDVRLRILKDFGLVSITALPRKVFNYARIQTVVLHLVRGHDEKINGETVFRMLKL